MIETPPPSILDRLLELVGHMMPLDYAKRLVELRVDPIAQARIDELAGKCNEGLLSDTERAEYENYVQAIHLIGILQRKAKHVLDGGVHP